MFSISISHLVEQNQRRELGFQKKTYLNGLFDGGGTKGEDKAFSSLLCHGDIRKESFKCTPFISPGPPFCSQTFHKFLCLVFLL